MITIPELNEASTLLDADMVMLTHNDDNSEKVSGIHLKESVLTVISGLTAGTALDDTDVIYVKKSNADLRKLTGAQIKAEVLGSISGLTAGSALADTDIIYVKKANDDLEKLTGAQLKELILGSISDLTASTGLNDTDIFLIKDSSNNLKKLTGALIKSASGANDAPLGSIMSYYGTSDPTDGKWLICDGRDTTGTAIELETHYPSLYIFLGGTNVLPDLREMTLVGAGENDTDTIAAHDVYTLGQFKDDQIQNFKATFIDVSFESTTGRANEITGAIRNTAVRNANYSAGGGVNNSLAAREIDPSITARAGTTTHGKQKGVNYIIKAISSSDTAPIPGTDIQTIESYVDTGLTTVTNAFNTKIAQAESYSTEEVWTGGYWIDGKKIYRRVFTGLSVSLSSNSFSNILPQSSVPNIAFIISAKGWYSDTICFNFTEARIQNNYISVEATYGGARTINTFCIKYTKTTD